MRNILLSTVFFAAMLCGCHDEQFGELSSNDPLQMSFEVTIMDGYPQSPIKTRGTPQVGITAYEDKKITVLAFDQTPDEGMTKKDFKAVLSRSNGVWSSIPQKAYDELMYNFYSFASDMEEITTIENGNGLSISSLTAENPIPTIGYKVPADVTKQPDLLIGNKVVGKKTGQVSLSMYHALSCVGFVATSKHIGNIRKVRSVTLRNVYGAGTAAIDKESDQSIQWTTSGDTGVKFNAGIDSLKVLDGHFDDIANKLTYLMKGDGYLMMIPQELPEGAQIVMEIWDGVNESSIHAIHYDIPPTTWEPGKKYMYYFDEPILEGVATYYERYVDGTQGLYYYNGDAPAPPTSTLKDNIPITDAGYGLLVPASTYTQYPSIYLGLATGADAPKDKSESDGSITTSVSVFTGIGIDCVLYPLSQHLYPYSRTATTRRGFQPSYIDTPVQMEAGVSETGSGKPINTKGYFLPHYAKGVYQTEAVPKDYCIRTPIQMRNISYQTADGGGYTMDKSYNQEIETLDFSVHRDRTVYGKDISGSSFKESIVIGGFGGTYRGAIDRAVIAGLIIHTPVNHQYNTSLFEWVEAKGKIIGVETAASCIYVCASTTYGLYVSGIVAINNGWVEGATNRAAITNNAVGSIQVGGVVGHNSFRVMRCENYGVINNQSDHSASATGGIVGWNERYFPSWTGLSLSQKEAFRALQYGDYSESMDADVDHPFPGAVISKCSNYGRIIGAAHTGGITAYNNYGGVVYSCTNSADIRNNGKRSSYILLGGIVGLQQCGELNNADTNPTKSDPPKFFSTVQNCINTGHITAISGVLGHSNLAVGGIIGNNDFAAGTNGRAFPDDGYGIEAYGRVNQCVVEGARISGYYSDTGGIAGLNSGSVNRSRCHEVYVGGVFGNGGESQRNSAGGIVGTNNNYVGNSLFTHSSPSSPISNVPVWSNSTAAGGIVGINNSPSLELKSESGYVQKCMFAAVAPANVPTGAEIGTFAPIAGWTGGYLFRDWKGSSNLQPDGVDATTGATPLYTIDDNYYASGIGVNYTDGNFYFPNEPTTDAMIAPFTSGRYPYGQIRISADEQALLPLAGWYGGDWEPNSHPPIVPKWYNQSYTLPSSGGTTYILGSIVQAIKAQHSSGISGPAIYHPSAFGIANTIRISLNYLTPTELIHVSSIEYDFSNVTFLSNNGGGKGSLFLRTPDGWRFDASQTDPKPYKMTITDRDGGVVKTYYYCMVNEGSGRTIKMIRQ